MKKLIFVLVIVIATVQITNAIDVGGNVWGIWSPANNPYNVISEIHVPTDSTLVIEPGVIVNFMGHYKFNVDEGATLYAVGTETDSIYFTCDTIVNPDRWHGIRSIHYDTTTQISYCHIEYGKAIGSDGYDSRGGGILVYLGNGCIISHCTIINNYAAFIGGGVYLQGVNPDGVVLCHNVISRNEGQAAVYQEFHVYSYNNLICNNYGTGVRSGRGFGYMINNTIVNNNPYGVSYVYDCPSIGNCIIWGNSDTDFYGSSSADMVYTDVGTGWYGGEGSFSADPLFRDSANGDFHLQDSINCGDSYYSPCIDAGYRSVDDSVLDCNWGLGGYRSDMGAYGRGGEHSLTAIGMIPDNPPVIVNPGGSFTFTGILRRLLPDLRDTVDVAIYVRLPNGSLYGPLHLFYDLIAGFEYPPIEYPNQVQYIPWNANPGEYQYVAYCGDYPYNPKDSAFFDFTIVPPIVSENDSWNLSRGFEEENIQVPLKENFHCNYPNPFNAKTSISFDLAQEGDVNLSVYNMMGQRVETLADDRMHAGQHSIIWDASQYSSGVYFYKLTSTEKTISKRMVLLK